MALFTDGFKYQADIQAISNNNMYTVKFYDGFVKKLTEAQIEKYTEKANREAKKKAEGLYGNRPGCDCVEYIIINLSSNLPNIEVLT